MATIHLPIPTQIIAPRSRKQWAYLAMLVVYLIWGTTMAATYVGVQTMPSAVLVCTRFLLAGFLLITFCLSRGERFPDWPSLRRECIVGFCLFFMGNSIVAWALHHLPTGLGGTLTATNPFWIIGLAAILPPKERITPAVLAGLLLGFAGILILLTPKLMAPAHTVSPAFWFSALSILVMVFFWALGTVLARKMPSKASILMGVGLQNLFSGMLLTPMAWMALPDLTTAPSTASVLALTYLILGGTIIATPCYMFALRELPVAVSSTFAYVCPVIAVLFGWLFLGEPMSLMTALGTAVILAGVVVVQFRSLEPANQPVSVSSARTL